MALTLAFEVPFVLKLLKPLRVLSFFAALTYTLFFYGTLSEWVW
jgi:hypothetical protein